MLMMKSLLLLVLCKIRFTQAEIDRKYGATNKFNIINKGRMNSSTVLMFLEEITLGECANYCIIHLNCHTVSYRSSARLCELNDMDFDDDKADKDAVGWINYGTPANPVCYGAKDENYGKYTVWKSGHLKALRLSHHSGGVLCNQVSGPSKWGCKAYGETGFTVVVTDENNNMIFPEFMDDHRYYTLTSTIYDDDISLSLTNPVAVQQGQLFRIWDLQDLRNFTEHNNSGTHCAYVELVYDE